MKQTAQLITVALAAVIGFYADPAFGSNFSSYLKNVDSHTTAKSLSQKVLELQNIADKQSSWEDPVFKAAAKNFPADSLAFDETPMTGVEIGISQKIPLSGYRSLSGSAAQEMATATSLQKEDHVRRLRLNAWKLAIQWSALRKEIAVLKESNEWLASKIKITKSLYSNGKATQQALFEIQIRKSSVQSMIESKSFKQEKLIEDLRYLLGKDFSLEEGDISWSKLKLDASNKPHAGEEYLQSTVKAKALASQAARRARVPDITVGAGYTFRSDSDDRGNFVSLSLGIPLPVTPKRHANFAAAAASEQAANLNYEDYKIKRQSSIAGEKIRIKSVTAELKIISEKTLSFAEASQKIVSKSYGTGDSTYVDLLTAELSLQEVRLKEIKLWSKLQESRATLKYLLGEQLW